MDGVILIVSQELVKVPRNVPLPKNAGQHNPTIAAIGWTSLPDYEPLSLPRLRTVMAPCSEKISTTNPQWGGRADLRIGGRSNDLLIGNQMPLFRPYKIKHFHGPATTLLPTRFPSEVLADTVNSTIQAGGCAERGKT